MRLAVVLGNLGGPDAPAAVEPFLFNLFNDPAIIGLPQPFRRLIAHLIASRRAPLAREIYARIGGASPILAETRAQADALERMLAGKLAPGDSAKVFIAMRYWHPFVEDAAAAVRSWKPDYVVLLPLYPQFSTTTTASFFDAWDKTTMGQDGRTARICCYPTHQDFLAAHLSLLRPVLTEAEGKGAFRLLFSAHGLPKRVVAKGDPYAWQIEQTAQALATGLGLPDLDWRICYQSRVGPMAWLEPSTLAEIRRAGSEGKGVVLAPIAFVSEHSETLVELDLEYGHIAQETGVPFYLRVPTLSSNASFIAALAALAWMVLRDEPSTNV